MNKMKRRYEVQFDIMADADIIKKLDTIPSQKKADYFRALIRKDIKKASR